MYKVVFSNHTKVYELYAKAVYQSDMYGFVEVEDFVFGEKSQMIVDPSEEKLRSEFSGVKRTYIPMHSILRIDEVESEGAARIREVKLEDKIANFPLAGIRPTTPGEGSD
jgi:hypothetical protein